MTISAMLKRLSAFPEAPRQALIVLALQVAAIGAALAPVALLRW